MSCKSFFPALFLLLILLTIATGAYFENRFLPDAAVSAADLRELAPPAPLMTIGEQIQVGGVGTFCWSDFDRGVSICADMIGIPTPIDPLVLDGYANRPFHVQFQLGDLDRISDLVLSYAPVKPKHALPEVTNSPYQWWSVPVFFPSLILPPAQKVDVELSLTPGLYVLNLFAAWKGRGGGSFGFLVEVR